MSTPRIRDDFDGVNRNAWWNRLARGCSWVEERNGLQLIIAGAPGGTLSVAQIDDYLHRPRSAYSWRPPLVLRTRGRASHAAGELLGTAGFGFWNNMAPLWGTRMEVYPNWIWFYYASPQSTISLTNGPTSGWKASIVHGGKGGETLMALSDRLMKIPCIGRALAGMRMPATEASLAQVDFTTWHDFSIEWLPKEITFWVDGQVVLHVQLALDLPLAFVAWLDNNYAALNATGEFDLGNLAVPQRQMLELEFVEIKSL